MISQIATELTEYPIVWKQNGDTSSSSGNDKDGMPDNSVRRVEDKNTITCNANYNKMLDR